MSKIKIPVGVHNRFDIELRDVETGAVRKFQAENIVLDGFWTTFIGSTSTSTKVNNYIMVGSGTGTLSTSRTTLFNHLLVQSTSAQGVDWDSDNNTLAFRVSTTLGTETLPNQTITEVGIGSSSGTTIKTHALLKDMNGNTVSITKGETEVMTIWSTVYLSVPDFYASKAKIQTPSRAQSPSTSSNFQSPGYLPVASNLNLLFGTFPTAYMSFSELFSGSSEKITPTITRDSANKKMTVYARLGTGSMNDMPIGLVTFIYELQIPFSGYAGTTITETIGTGDGTTTDFATKYPMISSVSEVSVNGTPVTTYTTDLGKPASESITKYLRVLDIDHPDFSYSDGRNSVVFGSSGTGSSSTTVTGNITYVFENPFYLTVPLTAFSTAGSGHELYTSDDLETWTLALTTSASGEQSIPAGHQGKRYFKLVLTAVTRYRLPNYSYKTSVYAETNIHFDTAPASGDEIEVTYTIPFIAKDADHVVDVTLEFTFNEVV